MTSDDSRPAVATPPEGDKDGEPAPVRRSRWVNTSTSLVLAGATAATLVAAAPPVLESAGLRPSPQRVVYPHAPHAPAVPVQHPHPQFDFSGDGDETEEPSEGLEPFQPRGDQLDDEVPSTPRAGEVVLTPRMGRTQEKIRLLDRPGGTSVGEIDGGEAVMVMKEKGGWVMLFHSGSHEMHMGWVEKKRIVIP